MGTHNSPRLPSVRGPNENHLEQSEGLHLSLDLLSFLHVDEVLHDALEPLLHHSFGWTDPRVVA